MCMSAFSVHEPGGSNDILCTPPPAIVGLQIEFHDMRTQLLGTLLSADDEESASRAEEALECVDKLLIKNYDLFAGRNGVPPIRSMDPKMVGGVRVDLFLLCGGVCAWKRGGVCMCMCVVRGMHVHVCSEGLMVLALSRPPLPPSPALPLACTHHAHPSQKDIVLVNACPATHNPTACPNVYSGLLTQGLFVSVESFVHLFAELVEGRGLAHGNHTVVQVLLCGGYFAHV